MEALEKKKYYRWTTFPNLRKVEAYLAEDGNYVYFESGRIINKELLSQELVDIEEEEYLNAIRLELFSTEPFNQTSTPIDIEPPQNQHKKEQEINPIKLILDKQKKTNTVNITVDFPIEIPEKKVLDFLCQMFDKDEVIEEVVNVCLYQIDSLSINETVKSKIKTDVISRFNE